MEHPRLRVQACRTQVVGDANLCTEIDELIERPALRRIGVRGRQYAQRLARFTVAAQRVEERSDAAAPDERHHDVDRVGRLDLGPQLTPQRRLAGRIGEQRRVEKRDQRPSDRYRRAVRVAAKDGMQD